MDEPTLILDAALALASAFVFGYVGRVSMRRRVEGDGRLAATLFGVWWYALAGVTATNALMRVLAYVDVADVSLFATLMYVNLFALCLALWALLYYLVYLFTGSKKILLPLSAFYFVYYGFLMWFVTYQHPVGVKVEPWEFAIRFEREIGGLPLVLVALLLLVPPVLGALNYARLYVRVSDPTQKYRIGLVSSTIVAWFGSALVAYASGIGDQIWWSLASRFVSLAAAWCIYLAYQPPAWVRERYGIRPVDEPAAS